MKRAFKQVLNKITDYVFTRESKNIHLALQRRALEQTTEFVEEHLCHVRAFQNRFDLLASALARVSIADGLFCEFGVYRGASINFIAAQVQGKVYGFDSFEGLPEDFLPGVEKGTAFRVKRLPSVRHNVELVRGWFNHTVPQFAAAHSEPCSFLHIDCDLYSSTRTVFENLGDRIRPETVIVFDEFFNYPGWQNGEYKAFVELVASRRLEFEYIGYVRNAEQVAVQIQTPSAYVKGDLHIKSSAHVHAVLTQECE